ncbi:MAG: hypothetical protein JO356_21650 [Acidobacteria bacterium]|nr:hypothetical protein [Acidobacteriota bacterium]
MNKDRKIVLNLLKEELAFLDGGGYKCRLPWPWRAAYIFEESPSCPNFSHQDRPHACEDCWLMEFVLPADRAEQVPCRFVQLTNNGVTVDSLYRWGTTAESEEALRGWLHEHIRQLEATLQETPKSHLP